jgi:dTDP-4-amino-4,6-dideoxygalactose transaminase
MTTGGGGMITTDDADLSARARHLVTQAKLPGYGYVHDEVGYNYRLTNIAAALGLAQLEQLSGFLAAKRRIAARYTVALANLPATPPPHAAWAEPSAWLYSVLLQPDTEDPERVVEHMASLGIQTRLLWHPLHRQRPYASSPRLGGGIAELIWQRGLSLPCSVALTTSDQDRVVKALQTALGEAGRWSAPAHLSRRRVTRREVRH